MEEGPLGLLLGGPLLLKGEGFPLLGLTTSPLITDPAEVMDGTPEAHAVRGNVTPSLFTLAETGLPWKV